MALYAAYGLVVMHVALGIMQYERTPLIRSMLIAGSGTVTALHLLAGWRERRADKSGTMTDDGWIMSGRLTPFRTRPRASSPPLQANASPFFAMATLSARSAIYLRIRMGRSAKAALSTAA